MNKRRIISIGLGLLLSVGIMIRPMSVNAQPSLDSVKKAISETIDRLLRKDDGLNPALPPVITPTSNVSSESLNIKPNGTETTAEISNSVKGLVFTCESLSGCNVTFNVKVKTTTPDNYTSYNLREKKTIVLKHTESVEIDAAQVDSEYIVSVDNLGTSLVVISYRAVNNESYTMPNLKTQPSLESGVKDKGYLGRIRFTQLKDETLKVSFLLTPHLEKGVSSFDIIPLQERKTINIIPLSNTTQVKAILINSRGEKSVLGYSDGYALVIPNPFQKGIDGLIRIEVKVTNQTSRVSVIVSNT